MTLNEPLSLASALVTGFLLGAMFLGGLWWTVCHGLSSKRVARWFLGGLLLRMGVVLAGFYLVSDGHWEQLLLCLLGFVMARLVGTWLMQPSGENCPPKTPEGSHAP